MNDEAVVRRGVDDPLEVGGAQRRRGRVVRVGEEHDAGSLGDRGDDSFGVEGLADEGHRDLAAAGQAGELGVGDEARPRVDDLVATVDVGQGELFEQTHRPRSARHPLGSHTDVGGEALAQLLGGVVGVAVDVLQRVT